MIDKITFDSIKEKHGSYASWAIWANERIKPKENMDDLSIFNVDTNSTLLEQLNPNYILVGLNISKEIEEDFANFHGPGGGAYKIRFALKGTPLWGAYMTDIIKDFEQKASGQVMRYLRTNKTFEKENIVSFRAEIYDLGVQDPTIVAFGKDAYTILDRNLKNDFEIFTIPHYSTYMPKEKYRTKVKSIIGF
jgi:hypothetical protein